MNIIRVAFVVTALLTGSQICGIADDYSNYYLDAIHHIRSIHDNAIVDIPVLLQNKAQTLALVEITAQKPTLLGDVFFDEIKNALIPFHRPSGEPPTEMQRGNIHVLRIFGNAPYSAEFPYVFQQPAKVERRNPFPFSPYSYMGTCDALVELPLSLEQKYLHILPETFVLPQNTVNAIRNMDVKSFLDAVLTSQAKITDAVKGGRTDEAISTAFANKGDPILVSSNVRFLINSNAITSYDAVSKLLMKIRGDDTVPPELPSYLLLTTATRGTASSYIDDLARYVKENASAKEVEAISWSYLACLQTNFFVDKSNILLPALMEKLNPNVDDNAKEISTFLSEIKPIPR
jgi:hypothetical protein